MKIFSRTHSETTKPARKTGKVTMLMRSGRSALVQQFQRGESPADFLYGYPNVEKRILNSELIEFSTVSSSFLSFFGKLIQRLDQWISFFFLTRIYVFQGFLYCRKLKSSSVIITNIDSIGLSLAFAKFFTKPDVELIHISQGLTNQLSQQSELGLISTLRCHLTRILVNEFSEVIVLGEGAQESLLNYHLVSPFHIRTLQFGIDVAFWGGDKSSSTTRDNGESYILSVGSDAGRDYRTLLLSKRPCDLVIVTRTQIAQEPSVKLLSDISDRELRDLYRQCLFMVIPLRDIPQPSGQSAALQAMATGATVIITKTEGFWNDTDFLNNRHLVFVKTGDADELSEKMQYLYQHEVKRKEIGEQSRMLVYRRYDINSFGNQLSDVASGVIDLNLKKEI